MSRILFAWELGANYGHLVRSLPVAERLRVGGHGVLFAVRDTRTAAELLGRRFPFLQAPVPQQRGQQISQPASYAEMLLIDGWGDRLGLLGQTQAWCNLLALAGPDLLVADHAPTALLAAYIAGIPAVAFGSGFENPPALSPLPTLRPWENLPETRLQRSEQLALDGLNTVAGALGRPPLARLADIFPPQPILATFAELDHYGPRDDAAYVGSIHGVEAAETVAWPAGEGPRVFAYLRSQHAATEAVLSALSLGGIRAVVVLPGASQEVMERFASPRLNLYARPVSIGPLLAGADAVVGYGGGGIIASVLLAGVPLLLVPQLVEQYLGAQRVVALGAGIALGLERNEGAINAALTTLMRDPSYRQAAERFADKYRQTTPDAAASDVATAILAVAGTTNTEAREAS